MSDEHVLVVPTEEFHAIGHFQGFSPEVSRYVNGLIGDGRLQFRKREAMEKDPSFKQLIPYLIVEYKDAAGNVQLFRYIRGGGQGEARLHEKWSIGVGGHINIGDVNETGMSAYMSGMNRELDEELIIPGSNCNTPVGLVNDDSNEVGQVHLGVVHRVEVFNNRVTAREESLKASGFVSLQELYENIDKLETWSKLCLEALYPVG